MNLPRNVGNIELKILPHWNISKRSEPYKFQDEVFQGEGVYDFGQPPLFKKRNFRLFYQIEGILT